MAEILPSHWEHLALAGVNPRELHTLRQLAEVLPDSYTIVHGVHWSSSQKQRTVFGEIDFCVLSPGGRLLVIEQKNGPLLEADGQLFKDYGEQQKDVARQISRALDGIRNKFKASNAGFRLEVDYLLYCPEHRVQRLNSAQLDRQHIVDASMVGQLGAAVKRLLEDSAEDPQLRDRIRDFLLDTWEIRPDVNGFLSVAGESYVRLSGGLTTWAGRLRLSPYRLRVEGTAGSGKTQLALAEFRRSLADGGNPFYVCFNHPLAARLRSIAPAGGRIQTFHAICEEWIRRCGGQPDFTQQDDDFWPRMVRWAARLPVPDDWKTDVLIVDEGQDFHQEWADLLLRLVKPDGRVIWLEDPRQNLYGRPPVTLPGFAGLEAPANHRSPWRVHQMIERLLRLGTEGANPLPGYEPDFEAIDDADLTAAIESRIERFLRLGFRPQDIALISYKGYRSSALASLNTIGRHGLRAWTGAYDADRRQVFREGEVLFDSIFRFKGQQAPAVIFCEIDFEDLDDIAVRRLYCGMTRASVALDLLMTHRAAQSLIANLGE